MITLLNLTNNLKKYPIIPIILNRKEIIFFKLFKTLSNTKIIFNVKSQNFKSYGNQINCE